ncbi:MAG: hypothetical protein WC330_00920 [Candidatus Omnitrophota bacterium]|jgi:hypothetical protein
MDYESFLVDCSDINLRNKIWELFNQAEPEAKYFCNPLSNWVELTSVKSRDKSGGRWRTYFLNGKKYAKIEIYANWDELGLIFHEIFHSAFSGSLLVRNELNNKNGDNWGDGFCNAFRWFMETRVLKKSHWLDTFRKTKKSFKILNTCDCDYQIFKEQWVYLNDNSDTILDDFFC